MRSGSPRTDSKRPAPKAGVTAPVMKLGFSAGKALYGEGFLSGVTGHCPDAGR
ncbi:hypothetical protein D3C71_2094360 [compost metagenome]